MYIDANRLRSTRIAAKLSLRGLSDISKVSKSAIAFYESGKKQPKIEAVKALAAALKVSVEYLSGESDEKNTAPTENELSEDDAELLSLINKMPPDMKAMYKEALRAALKTQGLI